MFLFLYREAEDSVDRRDGPGPHNNKHIFLTFRSTSLCYSLQKIEDFNSKFILSFDSLITTINRHEKSKDNVNLNI